jgi:hypothetical protein
VVKLKAQKSPRLKNGPFSELTWEQQRAAEQWLWKFCARWEGNLPNWRRAILIGVAKRLAVNPPVSNFARSLNGYVGAGVFAQVLQREGRPHPGGVALHRRRMCQAA